MIPCMCIVQAGQISPNEESTVRNGLESLSQRAFGRSAQVQWIVVPENSGFTAGKPSTSVLVSMQSDRTLDRTERHALLTELCDLWIDGADCSLNEVVASIPDPVA